MPNFPDLSRHSIVAFDTETNGVSFRSRPVGFSWATVDGESGYLRWGHEQGGNNCDRQQFVRWAKAELTRPGLLKVAFNAAFDCRMLAYIGVKLVNDVEDAMIVAAILDELSPSLSLEALSQRYLGEGKAEDALDKACAAAFGGKADRSNQAKNYWRISGSVVEPYAKQDAVLTLKLYQALRPRIGVPDPVDGQTLERVYKTETQLIPVLLDMHLRGVPIDESKAAAVKTDLAGRLQAKLDRWTSLSLPRGAIASGKQLEVVFSDAGLPVLRTETGKPSFTKEYLSSLDHEIPRLVRQIRALSKLKGTYLDNYILGQVQQDGRVHCDFNQVRNDRGFGTVSGRLSSSAPNLQNLPAREDEWAPIIRGMFVPVKGCLWAKFDMSQIEYRFFAHYAGGSMRDAYIQDPHIDFHSWVSEITGIRRKDAKTVNFAKLYGAGIPKMARSMGCSEDEARAVVRQYAARIPQATQIYDRASRVAGKRGQIRTWGGRLRRFEPKVPHGFRSTHKALNALLQGSAADHIKETMVRVAPIIEYGGGHLHLTVHDELDVSLPEGPDGIELARQVQHAMQDFPSVTVPLLAEVEIGPSWGAVRPLNLATALQVAA